MGFLSGILGGGTKVSNKNTTEVNTQVDIDLSNIIDLDLSGLESILQQLKDFIISDGAADAQFKSLIIQENAEGNELNKQQQTLLLLGTAVEAERNQQLAQANKTFKNIAVGGGILVATYLLMRGDK